jgi:hypothetical protein
MGIFVHRESPPPEASGAGIIMLLPVSGGAIRFRDNGDTPAARHRIAFKVD